MRGRKTAKNTVFSLMEVMIAVICGFILPRLILSAFGSTYNGLISSITQFLACAVLLNAGVGGATRAALYKPLAQEDHDSVNSIMKATDIYMKKIGLVLAGLIVAAAATYPFLVQYDFGWFFTFSLFLIIGASTFAESFFGITYLTLLQADQRVWVSSLLKCICYIANTVIGAVLILAGANIHMVKLGSAVVYVLYPVVMRLYVRRHYKLNLNCLPNNSAIAQRWDAFWQQVGLFVMNNTDVMVLTVFSNLLEVSVYSVYNLVLYGLKRIITSMAVGWEAPFGDMIARGEKKALRENLSVIEVFMYGISTIVYTSTALLILGFVRIYTSGVDDVDYIRPIFAYIMSLAGFFYGVRYPCQLVVAAAGHYKQTKVGAIIEPIMNIALSIVLVIPFGIIGVAIGTLAATIFRTVQYSWYVRKHLVERSWVITPLRILASAIESAVVFVVVWLIGFSDAANYFQLILQAVVTVGICTASVLLGSFIFFRKDTVRMMKKLKFAVLKK